ncbi:MAG: hypothetical protein IBX41_03745 [Methanophagales archaeon]|nr:hypothetical protein [Methanophagales archaeon]
MYLTEEYTSQPTPATFTYTYAVTAGDGDLLEATAYCSLFGSKTERITIAAPSPSPVSTPSPTATPSPLPTAPPPPSATPAPPPGFDVLFALSSLVAAIYLIKRKG